MGDFRGPGDDSILSHAGNRMGLGNGSVRARRSARRKRLGMAREQSRAVRPEAEMMMVVMMVVMKTKRKKQQWQSGDFGDQDQEEEEEEEG